MGKFIRLKKGFTINLAGKAAPKIVEIEPAEAVVPAAIAARSGRRASNARWGEFVGLAPRRGDGNVP